MFHLSALQYKPLERIIACAYVDYYHVGGWSYFTSLILIPRCVGRTRSDSQLTCALCSTWRRRKSPQMLWFTSVVSPSSSSPPILITYVYPDQVFRWRTAGSVFWLLLLATPVLFTLRILTAAVWGEGTAGLWSPWWLGWVVVYLTCLALLQTSHAATCTGVHMSAPPPDTYCSAYFISCLPSLSLLSLSFFFLFVHV